MTNNKQQTVVDFVPYELALELKQLGFDEPCLAFYDGKNAESFYFNSIRDASGDYIPFQKHDRLEWFGAPLYQQAFRWFREKYDLNNFIYHYAEDDILHIINFAYNINNNIFESDFKLYEEAELACLKKLIEIANDK